ncbi:hypothetical protein GCM10010340_12950 [Streptomyces griseoloalbus]|nr:hypothetical protein GCM10010340_12950 [Streptomyces albaduncus]
MSGGVPAALTGPHHSYRSGPENRRQGGAHRPIERGPDPAPGGGLFCRRQQALPHSRSRRHAPAFTRRTAPWVSIPVRELDAFWEEMANRNRKAPEEDEQIL